MTKPIIDINNLETHSDATLLSAFLRTRDGRDGTTRAIDLLTQAGSLRALIDPQHDQTDDLAISSRELELLLCGVELGRRMAASTLPGTNVLTGPGKVRDFLALQISSRHHEVFCAIFLDNRHRVIRFQELFNGTIDGASVYPREVVKRCLALNAAAVIFAHNHPSGVAEPSEADINITRKLSDALSLVDVRVLDHLVMGQGVQTSLAERGMI